MLMVKVLEECGISPNPSTLSSISSTSLPLTFLDIPWLFFPPSRPLFFYNFPYPTSHFSSTILPNLKLSLSLTLQHFYPFAGTLLLPPQPAKPEILIGANDAVSFTVAESNGDFNHLCSLNNQRDLKELQALAAQLGRHDDDAPSDARAEKLPLLAVRITVFPNSGFCLGLAFHHVVADGRTFNNFMKLWSSFCSRNILNHHHHHEHYSSFFPSYDRRVIVDPRGLESIFLKEWWKRRTWSVKGLEQSCNGINETNNVHTTIVMGLVDIDNIRTWVIKKPSEEEEQERHSLDFSPYVLTCAYLWVCVLKSQEQGGLITQKCACKDPDYFAFVAGGLTRVDYPVPATYLGNCVGFGRATVARGELLGEDGVLVAAKAIRSTVKRLDRGMLGGAEKWISEWEELIGSDIHVMVSGSPKVDLYGRDFGWGRPKKIDDIEIESTKAISLSESRDIKGGIEIGLVLPKPEMDAFTVLFKEGLKALS